MAGSFEGVSGPLGAGFAVGSGPGALEVELGSLGPGGGAAPLSVGAGAGAFGSLGAPEGCWPSVGAGGLGLGADGGAGFECGIREAVSFAMVFAVSEMLHAACATALVAEANAFVMETSAWLNALACGEPGGNADGDSLDVGAVARVVEALGAGAEVDGLGEESAGGASAGGASAGGALSPFPSGLDSLLAGVSAEPSAGGSAEPSSAGVCEPLGSLSPGSVSAPSSGAGSAAPSSPPPSS